MKTSNSDIRNLLKAKNIKHWKLADLLGVSETTLVRKLRKEHLETKYINMFIGLLDFIETK